MSILCVDDDVVSGLVLTMYLRAAGYKAKSAHSGPEALQKLAAQRFDLVILDLHMPDMSGFETLTQIRAKQLCPDTPIVVMTSSDENEDALAAQKLGAAGFFTKGHPDTEILEKIERLLSARDTTWIDDYHAVVPKKPASPAGERREALAEAGRGGPIGSAPGRAR